MPDYAKMYQTLFQAQTQAIDILQKAQRETEEIYIDSCEQDKYKPSKTIYKKKR